MNFLNTIYSFYLKALTCWLLLGVAILASTAARPMLAGSSASGAPVPSTGSTTVLTPRNVSVNAGQTSQLQLQIANSLVPSSATVLWSISPKVGSISSTGLYTAPLTVASQQTVKVVATVIPANPAVARVVLHSTIVVSPAIAVPVAPGGSAPTSGTGTAPPPTSPPASSPTPPANQAVTLPLEVMGANGVTQAVQLTVPSGSIVSGALNLTLQIHGLEYATEASVQVNGSAWIPLNSQNAAVLGLGANYGGIGGGFATLSVNVPLPAGVVQVGNNTVNFMFNGTDGNSSGYRVLALNFQAPNGSPLVPAGEFVQDNPANWTAPLTDAADIAAGKQLFQSAAITQANASGPPKTLRAHCGDCHTSDGHDLKYFNYSNHSIYTRAMFHGLNSSQANQIASYIRSLSTPAPAQARPWNPPYQPGPGLDSQPVTEWAAGAGLDAVLPTDAAMLPQVAPTQSPSDFTPTVPMNFRQTQLALQLPDWNHWLPRIHPLDAFGSTFSNSNFARDYPQITSALVENDPATYLMTYNYTYWSKWVGDQLPLQSEVEAGFANPTTPAEDVMLHSLAQWRMVKQWEIMTGFQLEGLGQTLYSSPYADARAWPNQGGFYTSPALDGSQTVGNGLDSTFEASSVGWYILQIILNSGNGTQDGPYPVDWGYTYGRMYQLNQYSPQAMLQMALLKKSLVDSKLIIGSPSLGQTGWSYQANDISTLIAPVFDLMWANTTPAQTAGIMQAYVINWLSEVKQYTPQQFYAGGSTAPDEPLTPTVLGPTFSSKLYFAIPRLQYFGVNSATIQQLAAWAQTMWPGANWSALTKETCTPTYSGNLTCR